MLDVYAVICTGPNNLKQLVSPNFTYVEGLAKFGLHLAVVWMDEKSKRRNGQTDNIYARI